MSCLHAPPLVVTLVGLTIAACGHASPSAGTTTAPSITVPRRVTRADYAHLARVYVGLSIDDPARAALRAGLLDCLDRQSPALIEGGDYDAVVAHLAKMTDLLDPEDFVAERLPRQLDRLARFVVAQGSPRGDEARVLSALLILRTLHEDEGWDEQYRQLADWGREARSTLPGTIERYTRLIEVWEEHERLTPAPEVQTQLARMHLERRDAIIQLIPRDGAHVGRSGLTNRDLRAAPVLLRRAPLDVAGVFLRHGDAASALTYVDAMGDAGGIELHLIRVLRDARNGDSDAIMELADAYLQGEPAVAKGLCRTGRRLNGTDPRYPLCLARVAAAEGDHSGATEWFAKAIQLAPDRRELYDEALEWVDRFMREGVLENDETGARAMARAAQRILDEHQRRWPDSAPSIAPERLHYVVGRLEMNAGNTDEARAQLEASVAAHDTAGARIELGRLEERMGRAEEAARHYRRALDLTPGDGPMGSQERAVILEHLADAFRAGGRQDQAVRMYRQAVEAWRRAGSMASADAQVHLGVLLDRLGRNPESVQAFRRAMELAPTRRDIYAQTLSYLVVSGPNIELANEVFVRAERQLSLEPEWKVYFALWVATVAARAEQSPGDEVAAVLQSYHGDPAWFGRLASFGAGELPYDELLAEASNVGQRAEAEFYEGTRRLASGDPDGAKRQFRQVLQSDMVNFFEFIMARELLRD